MAYAGQMLLVERTLYLPSALCNFIERCLAFDVMQRQWLDVMLVLADGKSSRQFDFYKLPRAVVNLTMIGCIFYKVNARLVFF